MRPQTLIIVALALTFGGIAAVGVLLFSNNHPSPGAERATMVLAAADVPRGETLTAESLVIKEVPADAVLAGVLTKIEDAVGRSPLIPLSKGEALLDSKLAAKGAGRGLASLIRKGMRAVTIPTPNVGAGVAGFIVPGSRVDVHWISNEQKARDDYSAGSAAPPLLESVEVLAVDDKIDVPTANRTEGAQMKSVTVQVKPEEADKLTPALSKGTVQLSLRNPGDDSRAPPRPAKKLEPPPPPPKPEVDLGLAALIKAGMRAVSIPTPNLASHVTGFIKPGDRVDIHWAPEKSAADKRSPPSVLPILENLEVLAVQEKTTSRKGSLAALKEIQTVTVQVAPEEAGRLALAIKYGVIHLSLRHTGDGGLALAPPPRRTIRIIRGVRRSEYDVFASVELHRRGDEVAASAVDRRSERDVDAPAERSNPRE